MSGDHLNHSQADEASAPEGAPAAELPASQAGLVGRELPEWTGLQDDGEGGGDELPYGHPDDAGMKPVSFDDLREASKARLPEFRNKHGALSHPQPDGSDWSPAQWLQAVLGELGEYANLRKKHERGDIGASEFMLEAARELADVQIYLDLLAFRLGIDLGAATRDKFNLVSARVGSSVRMGGPRGWYRFGEVDAPSWVKS